MSPTSQAMPKRRLAAAALFAAAVSLLCATLALRALLWRAEREPSHLGVLAARAYGGNDPGARLELHLLALAGLTDANRLIGEATLEGAAGVPPAQGLTYLRRAAQAGDWKAQRVLGRALLQGRGGITREPAEAARWLRAAAQAGDAISAYHLALLYRSPGAREYAPAAAIPWLQQAADRHLPAALFVLGNAYRYGEGVAVDEHKAAALYAQAAELDHPASIQALALAYQRGELGLTRDEARAGELLRDLEHAIHDAPPMP